MKLLFVVKSMESAGGAERVLVQVTKELVRRGHQVTLASFDAADSTDFYEVDGRVHRIWLAAGRPSAPTGALDLLKRTSALKRVLRRERPHAAIGFMHSAYVPLAFAAIGSGARIIASEHCVYRHYAAAAEKLALRAAAPVIDAVTVVSEEAKAGFPWALRRKMAVIPNPVEPNLRSSSNGPARRPVILSVGRLAKEKDHGTLVAAFARIAKAYPEWSLRIVGEGVLRIELATQVEQLGLSGRVELPGAVRDIAQEYSTASIFAVSSLYESFGLATAEALAAGLPVIGFDDCIGIGHLIQHGVNGLISDSTDRVASLARALEELVRSPETRARMGRAAARSVSRFSTEGIAGRWDELIQAVTTLR